MSLRIHAWSLVGTGIGCFGLWFLSCPGRGECTFLSPQTSQQHLITPYTLYFPMPSVLIPLWKQRHWLKLHLWNSIYLPHVKLLYLWLFPIIQPIIFFNNSGYNTYLYHSPILTIKRVTFVIVNFNCILKCRKDSGDFAVYADHQNSFLLQVPVDALKHSNNKHNSSLLAW